MNNPTYNKIFLSKPLERELCVLEIIGIYAITDDILKAIGHRDDPRRQMTNAEILTTALSATLFFHGNQETAREYMKDHS